jgi:hypothetical protein
MHIYEDSYRNSRDFKNSICDSLYIDEEGVS